ncbi:hypothetical protein SpCBS45565_g02165 [Spizellomyces sp. 'palustris']|nr:hypothetical protein SpCBS45565_g02165 [Spizellomyces sp. 'palustris']
MTFIESTNQAALDKIDELRKLGLTAHISLPQIAVIGDQSSGKSSLLEYLSKITFPKDIEMCTTFATEVVMRRASTFHAKAKTLLMKGTTVATVVKDILTIELSGPDYPMVTLVDLPGYVHTRSTGQPATIVQDIENIAETYIASEKTIVLAVIPANKDFETNVVMQKIEKHDPMGRRTMGVITKPDLMDSGTEHKIVDVMSGRKMELELGYHIIRNRSYDDCQADISVEIACQKEKTFFNKKPWNDIPTNDQGVKSLRSKLQDILYDLVEEEFPTIKSEIRNKLAKCNEELDILGPTLDTDQARRALLVANTNTFVDTVRPLIEGHYSLLEYPYEHYIRAKIQGLNEIFSATILKTVSEAKFSKLDIGGTISKSRGRELPGFLQHEPFVALVRETIAGWNKITKAHFDAICVLLYDTMKYVVERELSSRLAATFHAAIEQFVHVCKKDMYKQADTMFRSEQSMPTTYNHYFTETLGKSRLTHVERKISTSWERDHYGKYTGQSVLNIVSPFVSTSNKEYAIEDMTLAIHAYCKTAAKRYIDATCLYVIEAILFEDFSGRAREILNNCPLEHVKEPKRVSERRKELLNVREKLKAAVKKF